MSEFTNWFSIEFIILLFFNIILFFMFLSNRSKMKRLKKKYDRFMTGLSDRNLEEVIEHYISIVNDIKEKNDNFENKFADINRNLAQCIQKIGVVRFNAFENVGSDLSFSIALLDNDDNGVVLSGIYSRDSSSTYAKPVIEGKSKYSLSAEEIQAISIAKKIGMESVYTKK